MTLLLLVTVNCFCGDAIRAYAIDAPDSTAAAQNRAYAAAVEAEQNAAQRAGITMEQVDALIDMGYIPEEIEAMTPAQVDSILTKDLTPAEKEAYYRAKASMTPFSVTAEASAGYTYVAAVPDGGGSDEWFHPDMDTTERTINSVISGAKSIAQTIFNTTARKVSICSWLKICLGL